MVAGRAARHALDAAWVTDLPDDSCGCCGCGAKTRAVATSLTTPLVRERASECASGRQRTRLTVCVTTVLCPSARVARTMACAGACARQAARAALDAAQRAGIGPLRRTLTLEVPRWTNSLDADGRRALEGGGRWGSRRGAAVSAAPPAAAAAALPSYLSIEEKARLVRRLVAAKEAAGLTFDGLAAKLGVTNVYAGQVRPCAGCFATTG